jgi:Phenylalanyl-tRNA synthetase alpha subunit
MLRQINSLLEKGQNELNALTDTEQLPEWYQRYLGRKGGLTLLLKQLKTVPAEDRPEIGKVVNKVKQEKEQLFDSRQQTLK